MREPLPDPMPVAPPPALASARVLSYATVDDSVTPTGRRPVVVAGRTLGPVPHLAIGRHLSSGDIVLLHCDAQWDVLGVETFRRPDDARVAAEQAYAGITGKWRDATFEEAELQAFLDEEDRGMICSFCGRHPHEVDRIVTGHRGAAICEICIRGLRG
jgi:ClpX C4-type zinc finger